MDYTVYIISAVATIKSLALISDSLFNIIDPPIDLNILEFIEDDSL
jgi:hypothetical protein